MKSSKFTEAQIAFAIKEAEPGTRVEEVCPKMGISGSDILQLEEEIRLSWCGRITQTSPV